MTELEITLDFLEEPITAEFYALAGAPGRDGAPGADGHTPVITSSKQGHRTTVYVDGSAVAQIDDGEDGEDGQDGHSPVITASKSSGVTTISVDGVVVATISDGVDGQDGAKGDTGAAGHSPVVTASKSGKVTTVSVDGSPIATINDGEDGQDGQDGSDGQDGFSPSASVSKSGSTVTITVTDKNGTTTATVSDGQDGADGQDGHTPVKGTDYWTAADKAEIVEDVTEEIDLSDYVQKTDYASANDAGVVKLGWGVKVDSNGVLTPDQATLGMIQNGGNTYNPIVPNRQHMSVFFGLAKAAGDTTQSTSPNAVGNYTEEAKQAIRQMLGLPRNIYAEKIADVTTTEDLTELIINTDINGDPFALRKARIHLVAAHSTTGSNSNISAHFQKDGDNVYLNIGTVQLLASSTRYVFYDYEGFGAYYKAEFYTSNGWGNSGNFEGAIANPGYSSNYLRSFRLRRYSDTTTLIPSGSRIIIYGIRY